MRPHEDVVATTLPSGEVVLLHMGTRRYFTLNQTGSRIWEMAGKGMTEAEIAAEMERTYRVSYEDARASARRLITELAAQRLLVPEPVGQ